MQKSAYSPCPDSSIASLETEEMMQKRIHALISVSVRSEMHNFLGQGPQCRPITFSALECQILIIDVSKVNYQKPKINLFN